VGCLELSSEFSEQLMIELITNRIKVRASLVPAAAVIPAHWVFFIIVVVKKFLAMVKFVPFLDLDLSELRNCHLCFFAPYLD